MRLLATLMFLICLVQPGLCQTTDEEKRDPSVMGGFLYQTAITPESYLITNEEELKVLVERIPPSTPYKALPAPPNPDPFLNGFKVNFEENILVVAVGRDRIEDPPIFEGIEEFGEVREVYFLLPVRSARTYPYGWAVYTAIVLPRIERATEIVVTEALKEKTEDFPRAKFPRL